MNILIDTIPAASRRYVYAAYALIGLILGACQLAGLDVATALAIYGFVGTALGLTAYANTGTGRVIEYVSETTGDPMISVTTADGTQQHFAK